MHLNHFLPEIFPEYTSCLYMTVKQTPHLQNAFPTLICQELTFHLHSNSLVFFFINSTHIYMCMYVYILEHTMCPRVAPGTEDQSC